MISEFFSETVIRVIWEAKINYLNENTKVSDLFDATFYNIPDTKFGLQ